MAEKLAPALDENLVAEKLAPALDENLVAEKLAPALDENIATKAQPAKRKGGAGRNQGG